MFQLVDIRYVCLVHFLLYDTPEKNSQQDLSPVSSEAISQVVWNPVSVRTKRNSLTTSCVVMSGKDLTLAVSM